jgi:hypothetical protein
LPHEFRHVEVCAVDLLSNSGNIRVIVCYRAPTSSNRCIDGVEYVTDLSQALNTIFPAHGTVIICGDFNFPSIDWQIDNCLKCSSFTCTGVFLEFFYKHGLSQFVTAPTRLDNILDIVLCNDPNCIVDTAVSQPFSTSDHGTVDFSICFNPDRLASYSSSFYDFNKADWPSILLYLSNIDFYSMLNGTDSVKDKFNAVYAALHDCINLHVPLQCHKTNKSKTVYYPAYIRRQLRKKTKLWRLYRQFRTQPFLDSYNALARKCRTLVRNYISERELKLIDNGNIGAFYSYANKKFNSRSSIGPLKDSGDSLVTDSLGKAEVFNRAFATNFTVDNGILPDFDKSTSKNHGSNNIIFSTSHVRRAIKKLNAKTKGGPDGIPPIFFKNCCDELCYPLTLLYQLSFTSSFLPPEWLGAIVTPIFKKGCRSDPNNYRPVALTATMCKLMECIIKTQLLSLLVSKGLISKNQHGFLAKHSTTTNLLECTFDWLVTLSSRKSTDIIYIDFARAFDSVVFTKLLFKLENMFGISGNLLKWISAFLLNRTQCVAVDYCLSNVCVVTSGVPQGSVLGPILFLIFINDIDSVCCGNTILKLFADDAKLYSEIEINCTSSSLQNSLDHLVKWADLWQLKINISKCHVLSTSNSNNSKLCAYYLNNVRLSSCENVMDLGVTVSINLSFNMHINNIVAKSLQRVSTLFRGFITRDLLVMRKAFITYIRPLVEYNSLIWSPSHVFLIDLIESVQRKFTKRIPCLSSLCYADRLTRIALEPLELRRLRFDLLNYYKILHNLSPLKPSDYFLIYHPPETSRSSTWYLHKPIKASNSLFSSFFFRNVDSWNSLPAALRSSSSLSHFKTGLSHLNLSPYLKGSVTRHF